MAFGRAVLPSMASRLFGGTPASHLALLRASWALVVGREIARRSEVISLDRRMLNVRVADGRWQKVLHRMEREILSRLAALVGELAPKHLGFTQGPIGDDQQPNEAEAPTERLEASPPLSVALAAEAIDDTEVRASFLRAAGLYLERRDHA